MAVNSGEISIDKSLPQANPTKHLAQFGYSYFRPTAAGFAPQVDIPVAADYVIGPGDTISLKLWGSIEGAYDLEVNRNGEIFLPRVGSVKVWGVPFGSLQDVIRANLSKVIKDYQVNVSLGKLRVMKVYLVGEVKAPGDYNLGALSTLLNALSAAGGPTKNGSLRNIQIKRGGKVAQSVDLYDFFLKGDKNCDIRLQAGDTLFVPVIGAVAGIAGNVRRPAIYELKGEATLKDLISLADGVSSTGYLQRVQISRVEAHEKKIVTDFNLDPKTAGREVEEFTQSIRIKDLDVVRIFPIDATLRGYVRLDGYVLRPGDYALQPGMRVSSLLPQENLLHEYNRDSGEITRLYPPDFRPKKFFFNLGRALAGEPSQDIELKEFDRVRIFSRWEMEEMPKVKIGGEVQKPGEFRLLDDMTVRDLVMQAGNTKMSAYTKSAEITRLRRSGDFVSSFSIKVNLEEALKGNPKDNIALAPFDELTVRRIPNWAEAADRYVTLKGEFRFPGAYPIFQGERLSSVIERAGGFTDKAYLNGAKFTRETVRALQQKRMEESIAKAEEEILKKQSELASISSSKEELDATKAALDGLKSQVDLLKTKQAEGRLILKFVSFDSLKNSRFDMELMGGDALEVPKDPNAVNIMGQVYNTSGVVFVPHENVKFYLDTVGGPTKEAETDDVYLVKIDGSVISKQQSGGLFFNNFNSKPVDSGDTIVVPQRYEKVAWMRDIKDIATILGQIALTAGVMLAAGL